MTSRKRGSRACRKFRTLRSGSGPLAAVSDPHPVDAPKLEPGSSAGPADTQQGGCSCYHATSASGGAVPAPEGRPSESTLSKKLSTEEIIQSVISELEGLEIDNEGDGGDDHKDQMVRDLIKQTREMEAQLKERKEWAQAKAMQAAQKLGRDLAMIRSLRMAQREYHRQNKEKQVVVHDDSLDLERLSRLEAELRGKSGLLDRSNAAVQRLDFENAEIRAEIAAAKLSASETGKQCQSLVKKHRKDNKKLEAWERQKSKLKEELADCKTKITQAERELAQVNKETKDIEIKIWEDTKTKKDNIELLEEERRESEAAKVNADCRLAELRRKKQVESQCCKDDLHRLQDELKRLQKSGGTNEKAFPSTHSPDKTHRGTTSAPILPIQGTTTSSRPTTQTIQKPNHHRECVVCRKEEASVILLQCAHQVLCDSCNKHHQDMGVTCCPNCCAKVDERIKVFGASSN